MILLEEKLSHHHHEAQFFLVRVFQYSVQMRENTDQKNSVFGHFSRSVKGTLMQIWKSPYMFQFIFSQS